MHGLETILKELEQAKAVGSAISAFSTRGISLSVEEAYSIQGMGLERCLAAGEMLSGYKLGLTSRAKQRDVSVFEPIFGFLLKSMEIAKGLPLSVTGLIHPRLEPELAVQFERGLKGRVTLMEVERAIGKVLPAIEAVDSRYQAFAFNLPDVVADNTSACRYFLGTHDLGRDWSTIRLTGVVVRKNGEICETGCPAAVLGDPLIALQQLPGILAERGRVIEPGAVVLTGGLTASSTVQPGDRIEVQWPQESMSVEVVP